MNIKRYIPIIDIFYLIITSVIFVLGAVGVSKDMTVFFMIANAISIAGYILLRNTTLQIPKYVVPYTIFLIILLIHAYIVKGNLFFFWLYFSGLLIWIYGYNFKNIFKKISTPFLIVLGIAASIIFSYIKIKGIQTNEFDNILNPPTDLIKHSHLGDFWAVVLVGVIHDLTNKASKKTTKILSYLAIVIGFTFIILSYSRSAIISLVVGILYLFVKLDMNKKIRYFLTTVLSVSAISFLVMGIGKSTLFSRPYFAQSVLNIYTYPLGVGMGNFSDISKQYNGLEQSNLTHNIFLEFISGTGVFSLVFIYWILLILRKIFRDDVDLKFSAIFLAVLANFSFNVAYIIPAMVWILFFSLSLIG